MTAIDFDACLRTLTDHAERADREPAWPDPSWDALKRAGVLRWSIEPALGGTGLDTRAILDGNERLAGACLTTCFLLSQREAAIRRIRDLASEPLRRELLVPLAEGARFATVGLSQLTTSRQHGRPSLSARTVRDGYVLNGTVPWVTGAQRADHFLIGAATDDGQQLLLVVPSELPGVRVGPPLDLMALRGSMTAAVQLDQVLVERRWLLAGPAPRVLARGGPGGLETSCLALGLARAAIEYLAAESATRPELTTTADNLQRECRDARADLHRIAVGAGSADDAVGLRTRANSLVLRATQAALMTSKGTGFVHPHPAQRWARQALFFLVWSCPRPTADATLAQLAPPASGDCSI